MQVLNTVSHCPGEITHMLSLHNHHTSTEKKSNTHKFKRLHLSVWRRLLNSGRGSWRTCSANRRPPLAELWPLWASVWVDTAGRLGWAGVGGWRGQTDRGLCLSWSPAHSALYFRRMAPRFLRHTGGPVFGGHVWRRAAAALTCVGLKVWVEGCSVMHVDRPKPAF